MAKCAWEHRTGAVAGFATTYGWKYLVCYQAFEDIASVRYRELQIKTWKGAWNLREIEGLNPARDDLFQRIANQ